MTVRDEDVCALLQLQCLVLDSLLWTVFIYLSFASVGKWISCLKRPLVTQVLSLAVVNLGVDVIRLGVADTYTVGGRCSCV